MTDRDKSQEVREVRGEYPLDGTGRCPQRIAWRPIPLGGGRYMQRVNGYAFYQLSTVIHPLTQLDINSKLSVWAYDLHTAREWLRYLLAGEVVPLRVCKAKGNQLINTISEALPTDFPGTVLDQEKTLDIYGWLIPQQAKEFETVLAAELQEVDTYFISKKGIYVTSDLIDAADLALDGVARAVISQEALRDFREAGKCLAFDLATAAGFHTMRATENVLRQYHAVVTGRRGRRSWRKCIESLKRAGEDPKTLGIADQIRDLHRNPVMHPEGFLTIEEAQGLFDIAKSAISAMAGRIAAILPASLPPTVP